MAATTLSPRLSVRRLAASAWSGPGVPSALGGLLYDLQAPIGIDSPAGVATRRLLQDGPMLDAWCSEGPSIAGCSGCVRWRHNGHWLYGALDLDENGQDLEALARRAYGDVFATLDQTGFAHLQRIWNYLPHINADAAGTERYRRFNAGRQQAFLDARRPAFEGAPAACALGTREGPFCVRFLAGRQAALPIENPRQVSAYHYPRDYGARSPTFSRAALVEAGADQVALLISGTSSIVGHASVHAGDVQAQTRETLNNLRAVVAAANARGGARFDLATLEATVYVRHAEQAPAVRATLEAEVGAATPFAQHALYLEADICRSDLLVEIEAHAFAPGQVGRVGRMGGG